MNVDVVQAWKHTRHDTRLRVVAWPTKHAIHTPLKFRQYDTFRPTSLDMQLSKDDFYKAIQVRELPQFPGHFEYVSYSIGQVCAALQTFVESKNEHAA